MKLVRLALREPKNGAREAREAKFIYVALAPALCRTGVGMKQFLECCAGIDIGKREMTVTILTGSVEVEPIPQVGDLRHHGTRLEPLSGVVAGKPLLHGRCGEHGNLLGSSVERSPRASRGDCG